MTKKPFGFFSSLAHFALIIEYPTPTEQVTFNVSNTRLFISFAIPSAEPNKNSLPVTSI